MNTIFKIGGTSQMLGGHGEYVTEDNAHIVNKTKNEDSLTLQLRRESDGIEALSHLRIQDQFKDISNELLKWAFQSEKIIGLTLTELRQLETGLEIELSDGKHSIK